MASKPERNGRSSLRELPRRRWTTVRRRAPCAWPIGCDGTLAMCRWAPRRQSARPCQTRARCGTDEPRSCWSEADLRRACPRSKGECWRVESRRLPCPGCLGGCAVVEGVLGPLLEQIAWRSGKALGSDSDGMAWRLSTCMGSSEVARLVQTVGIERVVQPLPDALERRRRGRRCHYGRIAARGERIEWTAAVARLVGRAGSKVVPLHLLPQRPRVDTAQRLGLLVIDGAALRLPQARGDELDDDGDGMSTAVMPM